MPFHYFSSVTALFCRLAIPFIYAWNVSLVQISRPELAARAPTPGAVLSSNEINMKPTLYEIASSPTKLKPREQHAISNMFQI